MVRNILSYSGLALFLAFVAQPAFSTPANPERVYGWIEEGILLPENIAVKVKLDTGALTSSMDAKDLERFRKNGDEWVRFNVKVKDTKTKKVSNALFERRDNR